MKKATFKDPTLRSHYKGMVRAFETKHRDVGTPDARCTGNSFAGSFWKGFDGVTTGLGNFRDRASRQTLAYACYRAGQYCAALARQASIVKLVRQSFAPYEGAEVSTVRFIAQDARGMTVWVGEFDAPKGVIGKPAMVNRLLKANCGGRTIRDAVEEAL